MSLARQDSSTDPEKGQYPLLEVNSCSERQSSQSSRTVSEDARPEFLNSRRGQSHAEKEGSESRRKTSTFASKLSTARDSIVSTYSHFTGSGEAVNEKMGWKATACLMIAETISLGILSLPNAVSILGLGPGFVMIIGVGIGTTITGKMFHNMHMRHPGETPDYPTAVGLVWGAWGRWTAEMLMWIFFTFLMAGHIVLFRNMWISESGGLSNTCTLISTAIGAVCMGMLTLPKAFKAASNLSMLSSASIVAATFAVLIAISLKNHGDTGDTGHWHVTTSVDNGVERYSQVFLAISNIVVSYTGHCCYFNIMNEMKDSQDFPKALYWTNGVTISMYTIAGVGIYALAGTNVKSPALSSATPMGQRIAYGLAVPTIVVAGIILALVACKRIYALSTRCFKSLKNESTKESQWSWTFFVLLQWTIAYLVANGVPFFGSLLGLLGGLCGVPICIIWPAAFWLCDLKDHHVGPSWERKLYNVLASYTFIVGVAIMVSGLYGSINEIRYLMMEGGTEGWKPFSCALPPRQRSG